MPSRTKSFSDVPIARLIRLRNRQVATIRSLSPGLKGVGTELMNSGTSVQTR